MNDGHDKMPFVANDNIVFHSEAILLFLLHIG